MKERPSYYSILTADVRYDPRLKQFADCKVLYSEITALSNKDGYCHASNSYFAKLYDRPVPTISKWINRLIKLGYLKSKLIYRDGTSQIKERHLYPISTPINAHVNTYSREHEGGINADVKTPINAHVKENTTSINTTRVNKDVDDAHTTSEVENPFDVATQAGINVNSGYHMPIFLRFIKSLGNEVVSWAVHQTEDNAQHPNWNYLQTVLKGLEANHVQTVEQAEEISEKHKQQTRTRYRKNRLQVREEVPDWLKHPYQAPKVDENDWPDDSKDVMPRD